MATWSEENINKMKNILQARGQASQNLASGGQLLQGGIEQLRQGIGKGADIIQAEKNRRAEERKANLDRSEQANEFSLGLNFKKDIEAGRYADLRQKLLWDPTEYGAQKWYRYQTDPMSGGGWEPKDYGDKEDQDKLEFQDLENFFMNKTGSLASEGTIKGSDGKNLEYDENGRIKDWKNVDFGDLEKRLKTIVEGKTGWSKKQKDYAKEYANKFIQYRMRNALQQAVTDSKKDTGTLWRTVQNLAKTFAKTFPSTISTAYNELEGIINPPKNNDELISFIMGVTPGTSFIDQFLKSISGGTTAAYSKLFPEKKPKEEWRNQPDLPLLGEEFQRMRGLSERK